MKVLKFGGTSIGSAANIIKVKQILKNEKSAYIAVVSAISGVTNLLDQLPEEALKNNFATSLETIKEKHLAIANELIKPALQPDAFFTIQEKINTLELLCNGIYTLQECSNKVRARILSYGEMLSSALLHLYLNQEDVAIQYLDSKACIVANSSYLNADVDIEKTKANTKKLVNQQASYIAGGFIAQNEKQETVVLGRGGSDYSAAVYGAAINAQSVEIWSDVDGMLNANPNHVERANTVEDLSYKEAFELAYFGAKVLYPPTIKPLQELGIPLFLKNTQKPEIKGTRISGEPVELSQNIKGVSSIPDISVITISGVGMAKTKGTARRVFQAMEQGDVNVILITQACSEQSICLGISKDDNSKALKALENEFANEISRGVINPIEISTEHAILALVGDNMRNHTGLGGKIFEALGKNGINVRAIAQGASERNISIVIDLKNENKALNVLHEEFFEAAVKKVHLFINGYGNVGKEFINILFKQKPVLLAENKLDLRITGIANSSKYLFDDVNGLELSQIEKLESEGTPYQSLSEFQDKAIALNLRNSLFIDNTASNVVSNTYINYLNNSISVIGCNKIASSSATDNYLLLHKTAKTKNCNWLYETAVGAALPIIRTIKDLKTSGDKITKIEAVLSGSLNFIFNNYKGEENFASVVKQAMVEGYTEPNPLIDLSGVDVQRKILILSREAGYEVNIDEVSFQSFLPEICSNSSSNDALFKNMQDQEPYFIQLYQQAANKGCKLKVVAKLENNILSAGLEEVESTSPFYNLEGKDNVVSIYTQRYKEQPLIIKGAGAGASITASGVFSDLMSLVNQ